MTVSICFKHSTYTFIQIGLNITIVFFKAPKEVKKKNSLIQGVKKDGSIFFLKHPVWPYVQIGPFKTPISRHTKKLK